MRTTEHKHAITMTVMTDKAQQLSAILDKADRLLDRLDAHLLASAQTPPNTDWSALAWRWRKPQHIGFLEAVDTPANHNLGSVLLNDVQKTTLIRNTQQFLQDLPANHALLTGARGTGKSSLVKAVFHAHTHLGLRLIEVSKSDLLDLPDIVKRVRNRPERFIVFCDDLSFDGQDDHYKALKVILDGSITSHSNNVLIYATSNRKNLMPEMMADNQISTLPSGEVRPNDSIEEKIALAERFGLQLSFHSFTQDHYLAVAKYWLAHFDLPFDAKAEKAALQFSYQRGAKNGRIATQFAKDYAGRLKLQSS